MRGCTWIGAEVPAFPRDAAWRGETVRRNGVTTTACCDWGADTPRRRSSGTNAVEPDAISRQLSFAVTLGALVRSACSHRAAESSSGWHQTGHSSEAFGPTANASTIERTAARTTVDAHPSMGKTRARLAGIRWGDFRAISRVVCRRTRSAAGFRQ